MTVFNVYTSDLSQFQLLLFYSVASYLILFTMFIRYNSRLEDNN